MKTDDFAGCRSKPLHPGHLQSQLCLEADVPANARALSVSHEFHCTSQHFPLQQLIPRVGLHLVNACTQFILHCYQTMHITPYLLLSL